MGLSTRKHPVQNTDITPDLLGQMALDDWAAEVDHDNLTALGVRFGALEAPPNLDELVWTPED